MKLQFKEQNFQVQAVKAIVDCFAGQALKTNRFTLERSRELIKKAKQAASGAIEIDYSIEEEIGYRNSPVQILESQVLRNIQAVQKRNDLHESQQIERPKGVNLGYNFTIEMETGTGKTYTYIRTMYELHKHYGWSKFIVIIPSIAIREGVYKSFQVTQDHFQELYGHKINPFIYNSGRPQDIENFASDSRISVMIINTQAFNASGADARRIYQELDHFGTRKPIDIIAQTNPILIIDEPQSVDGEKTLKSMQDFNPLFTLRYSATHKVDYNKVYRLDALDAYNKRLVKKIQVKGINLKGSTGTTGYLYLEQISLSATKPPFAVVEFEKRVGDGVKKHRQKLSEGANLYELSGNMPAYKNQTITEINGYLNKIIVAGEDIYPGDILNDKDENAFRRIQIRECIMSHLQKEKQLFEKGIKVLSLFFIDSVEKYRIYDETGEQALGEYAKIFEEEYNNVRNDFLDLFQQEYNDFLKDTDPGNVHKGYMPASPAGRPANYGEYLKRDDAHKVHEGYFSIDKKGKSIDPSVKRGSEESDDISAYDLIMKDKERLLSFEEPTRFIFSHSALKEGWDNPNVFQICALKNAESGSQTRRRQEVGRGMRLCVNKNGNRLDFESVGDQVHEINKLTVIASESYEAFAKGLQNEIAATLKAKYHLFDKEWAKAKAECDFIIDNSPHTLLTNFAAIFDQSNPASQYNQELIFVVDFTANQDPGLQFTRTDDYNPRIRDEPSNRNGNIIVNGVTMKRTDYFQSLLLAQGEDMTGYGWAIPLPDFALKSNWQSGDLRYDVTIVTNYIGFPLSFPYFRKSWNLNQANSARQNHPENYIVFRLADIYLMAAEAENELNGPANAYKYVNKVRERAFNPDQPWSAFTQAQFRTKMYDERKFELAAEGHRRMDLIRWGILLQVVKATKHRAFNNPAANIKPYHVLLPIPEEQVNLNPNLLESDPTNNGYR